MDFMLKGLELLLGLEELGFAGLEVGGEGRSRGEGRRGCGEIGEGKRGWGERGWGVSVREEDSIT